MDRERITISIKKSVLESVDKLIDGTTIRNRSHALETLIISNLGNKETKNVVILLGGDNALKHVPAVERILPSLKKNGFDSVFIATGFLGDKVRTILGDGSKYKMSFTYCTEGEGSGGAIHSLKKSLDSTFLVVNPENEADFDFRKILKFHKKHGSEATIATKNLEQISGAYVFEPSVLSAIPKGFSMIEEDLIPKLLKEDSAIIFPLI